jgi:hypothetical protein
LLHFVSFKIHLWCQIETTVLSQNTEQE